MLLLSGMPPGHVLLRASAQLAQHKVAPLWGQGSSKSPLKALLLAAYSSGRWVNC